MTSKFKPHEFEPRLSYEFFKYSFELFQNSISTSHIDWLYRRIRPLQFKDMVVTEFTIPIIHSHYLNQMDFNQLKEKQHLVTLLQLLMFFKGLKIETAQLRSKFLKFNSPLQDFLNYTERSSNHYQLNKLLDFFDLIKKNFVIEAFSDSYYRMLVTIPEVYVDKTKRGNWQVEIWIAEELFDYLYPFLLEDVFKAKLQKEKFQVLYEVIKIYSSIDIRKEFDIQEFLNTYPSNLSGKQKRFIKEHFIEQLQLLYQRGRIRNQVLDINTNRILNIHELKTCYSKIAVFETIDVKFNKLNY